VRYEVIVVDNNSEDEGLIVVKKSYTDVNFIDLPVNGGFAAGNNAGIKHAKGRVIMLLNPDAAVWPNTIQRLYDKLTEDKKLGIIGPKSYYGDGDIETRFISKKFPSLNRLFFEMFYLDKIFSWSDVLNSYYGANFDYDKEQYVDTVSGACFVIKREVIDKIGLLDEKFFLYFEEIEWCYRTVKMGYKILYEPSATITHLGGKSSAKKRRRSIEAYYESQLYFFRKHYGSRVAAALYIINILGFTFRIFMAPFYIIKDKNFYKTSRHFWALIYHLDFTHMIGVSGHE
jgi:hypothetical protein